MKELFMPGIKDIKMDDPGGRPSKYRPEFDGLVKWMIVHDGNISDAQIAHKLGVHKSQISRWRFEHEGFRNAYNEAWDHVNAYGVERSLLQRATGYEYTETLIEERELEGGVSGKITRTIQKHMPPDMRAIELFLRNRAAKRWHKGDDKSAGLGSLEVHIHTEPKDA
jgi:hypothetical protein